MWGLVVSSLRLLISTIWLSVRKGAKVNYSATGLTFKSVYDVSETDKLDLEVTQFRYHIVYKFSFMPSLKRNVYRATLVRTKGNAVVDKVTQWYPEICVGGYLDPQYPLACVANAHIDRYFDK